MSDYLITEGALRRALCSGQITPAIQPIVRAPDGIIKGVEVLARWYLPDGRAIPPDKFILQASRSRLEVKIVQVLMEKMIPAIRSLVKYLGRPLIVGFNAGPGCIIDPAFESVCASFLSVCNDVDVTLAIEITEREPLTPYILPSLMRLRDLGIKVVLDDFGSGYATGDVLPWLSPDVVKLDRVLTALGGVDDPCGWLNKNLKILQHHDIEIVAEGVETIQEYRWLDAQGVRLFQGYLFSKPLTIGDITETVRFSRNKESCLEKFFISK